ncbi:MAG: SPOR domain-containing protein [Bacteroidota bacterium]
MSAENIIAELLFDHDCVVIPGFGGFIGNYSGAWIQASRHIITPPFKALLFNVNLKQNDGLLANQVVLRKKISYDSAMELIDSLVARWNTLLNQGKTIELQGIGRLYKDGEGTIRFIQSDAVNYLQDAYGLSLVVAPPVRRAIQIDQTELVTESVTELPDSRSLVLQRTLKWAALIAIPLGTAAFFGVMHFEKIKSFSVETAGMLFPTSQPVPTLNHSRPAIKKQVLLPTAMINQEKPVSKPQEFRSVESASKVSEPKPFLIIVGAFRFKENAENMVADLKSKGYNSSIEGQTRTGLFRVSMQALSNKNDAINQLAMVRSGSFSGAWLLVK